MIDARRWRLMALAALLGAGWGLVAYWVSYTWRIAPPDGLLAEIALWPFFRGSAVFDVVFYDLVVCCRDAARVAFHGVLVGFGAATGVVIALCAVLVAALGPWLAVTPVAQESSR
jgi:hypothetical protein